MTIDFLSKLSWWHWDIDKITQHLQAITNGDIAALKQVLET